MRRCFVAGGLISIDDDSYCTRLSKKPSCRLTNSTTATSYDSDGALKAK